MIPREIQLRNILRCVVVSVIFVPASLAFKLISMPVIISDTAALVTPIGCVPRVHRVHEHALHFWFVLNILFELAERPNRMPVCVR